MKKRRIVIIVCVVLLALIPLYCLFLFGIHNVLFDTMPKDADVRMLCFDRFKCLFVTDAGDVYVVESARDTDEKYSTYGLVHYGMYMDWMRSCGDNKAKAVRVFEGDAVWGNLSVYGMAVVTESAELYVTNGKEGYLLPEKVGEHVVSAIVSDGYVLYLSEEGGLYALTLDRERAVTLLAENVACFQAPIDGRDNRQVLSVLYKDGMLREYEDISAIAENRWNWEEPGVKQFDVTYSGVSQGFRENVSTMVYGALKENGDVYVLGMRDFVKYGYLDLTDEQTEQYGDFSSFTKVAEGQTYVSAYQLGVLYLNDAGTLTVWGGEIQDFFDRGIVNRPIYENVAFVDGDVSIGLLTTEGRPLFWLSVTADSRSLSFLTDSPEKWVD